MTTAVSRFTKTATLRRTASSIPSGMLTISVFDEYGNPGPLVETEEEVPCHVRRLSADETPDGVESARWKLYLDPGTALEASDRVTIDGESFEVVDEPLSIYNPRTGLVESVQVTIEATS